MNQQHESVSENINLQLMHPSVARHVRDMIIPDNIEEIETAVGRAVESGQIKTVDDILQVTEFLEDRGLVPEGEAPLIFSWFLEYRRDMGLDTFDPHLTKTQEYAARFERLKNRPAAQKIIALGGRCLEVDLALKGLEELYNSVPGIPVDLPYCSAPDSQGYMAVLAFLEERFETEIKSIETYFQIIDRMGVKYEIDKPDIPYDENWDSAMEDWWEKHGYLKEHLESWFYHACEAHFDLALAKILREGGCYEDLLALNPASYGLPDEWESHTWESIMVGMSGKKLNKELMIKRALYFTFKEKEFLNRRHYFEERLSVRDIAESINAPYKVVLGALQLKERGK